ncbi:hypothetical protein GCM10027047_13040 [Rhodococcus aerolatus]
MVSTTAVTEAVTGVLRAPRRSIGTVTHLVPHPAPAASAAEASPVLEAVRRDPALTPGQRTALVELYTSFRAGPAERELPEVDLTAAGRAHVC